MKDNSTKILVVDDSAFMRQFVIGYLHEAGFFKIFEAGNGQLALEQYEKIQPQIVFLDLIMPVETGPDALAKLVAQGANVIIVSAVGQKNIKEQMLQKGARAYFTKPFFSSQEIGDKVKEIISLYGNKNRS